MMYLINNHIFKIKYEIKFKNEKDNLINENTLKLKQYMDTKEAQNEYKKRGSTVEAPFGILKIFYNYNNLRTHGIQQTENIMNLCALSHNIKRLYNIKHNILNEITEIDNFLEKLSTLFETELIATIK